jgi:hypothetical protein
MHPSLFIRSAARYVLAAWLVGAILWSGCDSSDTDDGSEASDTDVLVGDWNATSIKAGPVEVSGILGLTMTLSLDADGTGMIEAVDEDGNSTELSGTYSVDETASTITLTGEDFDNDLVIDYEIVDQDTISVELESSSLADLGFDLGQFGSVLEDVPITVELTRVTG